ncbi:hypothetical protein RJT34_25329 [Clitoria ternatea]|uniref:Uncharacterized protein n=1 Tax=Clitoria ternatea TaxID=43366 RepID=A0AAN9IIE5_CLITE
MILLPSLNVLKVEKLSLVLLTPPFTHCHAQQQHLLQGTICLVHVLFNSHCALICRVSNFNGKKNKGAKKIL